MCTIHEINSVLVIFCEYDIDFTSILTHWPLVDSAAILSFKFQTSRSDDILSLSFDIYFIWMPQDLIDDKSTLFQVMAWYHQTTR